MLYVLISFMYQYHNEIFLTPYFKIAYYPSLFLNIDEELEKFFLAKEMIFLKV